MVLVPLATLQGPTASSNAAQIFYLSQAQQPLLRKHIDGLPALYLDCDTDIDLDRDAGAREAYAKEISSFSEYVRKLRDSRWAFLLPSPCNVFIQNPGPTRHHDNLQHVMQNSLSVLVAGYCPGIDIVTGPA